MKFIFYNEDEFKNMGEQAQRQYIADLKRYIVLITSLHQIKYATMIE